MRALSRQEYALLSELAFQQVKVVGPAEASAILDTSRENAYRILSRLYRKGWLERIERGRYLVVPMEGKEGWAEHEFVYASQLVSPYYISYRTAMSYWGLTEQLPHVVFIATTKRRRHLEFQGIRFQFVTLKPRKFFGFTEVPIDGLGVKIADPEKTIVDCLDQEAYGGGMIEIAKALSEGREQLDVPKLCAYALRMGSGVLARRLGYLLDLLEMGDTSALASQAKGNSTAYLSVLFPKEALAKSSRWRLIINVPEEKLLRGREVI